MLNHLLVLESTDPRSVLQRIQKQPKAECPYRDLVLHIVSHWFREVHEELIWLIHLFYRGQALNINLILTSEYWMISWLDRLRELNIKNVFILREHAGFVGLKQFTRAHKDSCLVLMPETFGALVPHLLNDTHFERIVYWNCSAVYDQQKSTSLTANEIIAAHRRFYPSFFERICAGHLCEFEPREEKSPMAALETVCFSELTPVQYEFICTRAMSKRRMWRNVVCRMAHMKPGLTHKVLVVCDSKTKQRISELLVRTGFPEIEYMVHPGPKPIIYVDAVFMVDCNEILRTCAKDIRTSKVYHYAKEADPAFKTFPRFATA